VAKRQAEWNLKALEQRIAAEVRNAHTQLEMNRARIEGAQKARELAEKNLDAEQKKFQLGDFYHSFCFRGTTKSGCGSIQRVTSSGGFYQGQE
jgi:hypothetical protein